MKQDNGRNILSNVVLAIIMVLVVFGVIGAHLKIAELKEKNTELTDRVAAVEKKNEELTAQYQRQFEILQLFNTYAIANDKKIEKLEKEIAALKKEMRKNDKKHAAEIEKITAALAGVEKDTAELRGLIKQHADNLAELKEKTQAAFNDNNENLLLVVAKMNEIIDFTNGVFKKMKKLEKELSDLKNKKICPWPPWKKHKKE